MEQLLFTNGRVYRDGQFRREDVLVEDGKLSFPGIPPEGCRVVDLKGAMLVPGFLDLHTHGGDNVDVNAATAEDFAQISRFFARNGTTGWLCSILTDTEEQTLWSIGQAREAMAAPIAGARLLGIHLEGPFLSPDYETAIRAIDAGARACTHTFNAMGLFHQHRPSIMGAVLERPVYCEAICDGRHLHPGTVRMLLACKGWDRVAAVTDSIQAAGLPDGRYKLGVNDVVVEDGDAKLASNGVRAGSTLTTGQALKNLAAFTGQPVERVLPLLTLNPARLIGMEERKGSIAPGKDADLVVLDDQLNVKQTYVSGVCVYAGEE